MLARAGPDRRCLTVAFKPRGDAAHVSRPGRRSPTSARAGLPRSTAWYVVSCKQNVVDSPHQDVVARAEELDLLLHAHAWRRNLK